MNSAIVAVKPTNKAERSAAEPVEPRAEAEGNASQQSTGRTQSRGTVSQALERIRQTARQRKKEKFTALLHHINTDTLGKAFFALKRDAAPGVDGLTWRTYEADLDRNLTDLHERVHRGAYRALPSRRTYIPKADGRQSPLAIAALEDKIVQRATVTVLNAIYEEDFLGFSYGFRPGRGPHDALDALVVGIESTKVNWILDADIRSFFDKISQQWLIRFLEHRIGDQRIIRLIQKWLKAGILEDGVVTVSERGTGQGAVISPLLGNIYLHYVLDLWAKRWRRREATGDMIIVRYADDFIVGFSTRTTLGASSMRCVSGSGVCAVASSGEDPAHRVRTTCGGKPQAARARKTGDLHLPGLHLHLRQNSPGKFQIKRKSRRDRMRVKLQAIKQELRRRMHQPIPEQGKWLKQVVTGYFNYHAVPTNGPTLTAFRFHITNLWQRTLRRRSQKDWMTRDRIARLANDWLPRPRILHPWPNVRFAVRHPRWEPYARIGPVRICAGGAR